MNINATLIGQMLTFGILVWFTMKYVWPPMVHAMSERQKKIADGIAAAERGHQTLESAQQEAEVTVGDAKKQALTIIEEANRRANQILEDARDNAKTEGERILSIAKDEAEQEYNRAKNQLKNHIVSIAVSGAEKILSQSVDEKAHNDLLERLVADLNASPAKSVAATVS